MSDSSVSRTGLWCSGVDMMFAVTPEDLTSEEDLRVDDVKVQSRCHRSLPRFSLFDKFIRLCFSCRMGLCGGARSLESFGRMREKRRERRKKKKEEGFIKVCSQVK